MTALIITLFVWVAFVFYYIGKHQERIEWNKLINDLKEHEEESTCECCPWVKIVDGGDMLIIHNSYDGREILEQLNKSE